MKIINTPDRWSVLLCLGVALAFAAFISPARADSTTWTGSSDTNWFNDANWTNHVPTSSTDAFINTGKARIDSAGANARTVTIGANQGDSGGLIVDGTNGGSLTVSVGCGGNTSDPQYIGLGIYVGYGGSGEMSILNGGTVSSGYGYIALLASDGTHKASNGAVVVDGSGSSWTLSGCPDARLFVGGNNTEQNAGGTALLSVTSGGAVNVTNHTQALVSLSVGSSGTLTGNGTITLIGDTYNSRLAVVNGTLAPSGNLALLGHLALVPKTTAAFSVTPQTSDMVDVKTVGGNGGTALLDGRASVVMTGTFTPSVTRYTLLSTDNGLTNRFGSVSIKYPTDQHFTPQISYDTNHVYLDLVFSQGGL